ncbi:MAG: PBSX family phage terminase large subunit [Clostridia bacterium]|nr:PBSX family phage terminase large subunit [Clostridia bacterium]
MNDIRLSNIIAPAFYDVHRDIKAEGHREYILAGGRGSCKSSFAGVEVVLLLKRYPNMHAVVCRQIKDNLKDSVYTQIIWAIDMLGLSAEFEAKKSPMEIIRRATGQTIYFRGADHPEKIKSIKPPFGYIGILWLEELDQFRGEKQIRDIEQSVMRGGELFFEFKSFNPPRSASNWANKYALLDKPGMLVHRSTYLTVPGEWLGQPFFDEADFLRSLDESAYRHEYLGEAVGTGGNVFENLQLREITDGEIATFDHIYNGIDWGWYPDPFHFSRMHYDAARRALYIFDEFRANKLTNEQTAAAVAKRVGADEIITADNAELKSVGDYKMFGLRCMPAVKGAGSVETGIKWLQGLTAIVIDPRRCPKTAAEFSEYEYERTRDGEIISAYPDANNHSIDCVRYALERVWRRKGQ